LFNSPYVQLHLLIRLLLLLLMQVEGFKSVFVFDPTSLRLTPKTNLTRKRWYPTTITLPNGDIYVPGK
jgi:hypothetical protein